MNVDQVNAWIRTEAAVVFGGLAALVACAMIILLLVYNHEEEKPIPICYGVYGASGRFYPSTQPPYVAGNGLWYVITHDNWHAVGDFEATYTDRQCLREKHSDTPGFVPDVEGVD